jgi:8-oxo-dGTP pyrophosphatase MutT (NUDIX family)
VLILLYADRRGDLRVVITMRAASLRSFSGHAAFPGGKADDTDETPCKSKTPKSRLLPYSVQGQTV